MKALHKPNLWTWSVFNEERNLDFNSVLWVRANGNVVIDPVPLSPHDEKHLTALGGVDTIVVTNSDHLRDSLRLAQQRSANLWFPRAEQAAFPELSALGVGESSGTLEGLEILELHGSKTPGELALVIEGDTLVTGDLVRGPKAGALALLPEAKLTNRAQALDSVRRLAALPQLDHVLVGDGWSLFGGASAALARLAAG